MQLTRTKKIIGWLTLTIALALASVVGYAQQKAQGQPGREHADGGWQRGHDDDGGPRGGGMRDGLGPFAHLNLSDAQKTQMQQIAARYRDNMKAQRGGEHAEHKPDFDPLSGGAFDEAAVRAAAQARANAQVEREVAHAHMLYEMYNVLTPEQKTQLATERQQWEQKRQEFRSRRPAAPGATRQ